jgi:hypothetical protein
MRIIKFLLTSFVLMLILAGASFLIAREVLLFWGSLKINNTLSSLLYVQHNQASYIKQCKLKGNTSNTKVLSRLQLRFVSPQKYVSEIICDQFPNDPIVLSQESLPPFVQKAVGYSGVIWGTNPSGVVLELWGRQTNTGVINEEIKSSSVYKPSQLQPQTSCGGYGQICCQIDTQKGVGQVNSQANDCPENCFTSCQERPVVLSFTTDPFFDEQSRLLQIVPDTAVTFAYVASSTQKQAPLVTINFGDGTDSTATSTGLTGQFSHTYTCGNGDCTFTAHLNVQDQLGVDSASTRVANIIINVGNQNQ